jgi:ParB family chromosome partitioning protein
MKLLTSSETTEWYTPPVYTDAARALMGGIDLDPASCEAANRWIRAERFYTAADDGLSQPWGGRVWVNPPYGKTGSRSNQDVWAEKLKLEYDAGYVTQAVLLTKCVPGYAWWERLFRLWPVCFVEERIEFLRLNGRGEIVANGQAKAGTTFWYVGRDIAAFRDVFAQFGRIVPPPWPYTETPWAYS